MQEGLKRALVQPGGGAIGALQTNLIETELFQCRKA
ncbi:hypothetical protein JOD27_005185 [Lentzea nigeriaca]|nr:hypothetical protein [Lentzea nigeriaca]